MRPPAARFIAVNQPLRHPLQSGTIGPRRQTSFPLNEGFPARGCRRYIGVVPCRQPACGTSSQR